MMSRGKNCKLNGEKIQLNLESLKSSKHNLAILTNNKIKIIKTQILYKNSRLQMSLACWNKRVMKWVKINNHLIIIVNIKEIELIHMFYFINKIIF
jgi:hypothetical protein